MKGQVYPKGHNAARCSRFAHNAGGVIIIEINCEFGPIAAILLLRGKFPFYKPLGICHAYCDTSHSVKV
jgi:hypothetical protein